MNTLPYVVSASLECVDSAQLQAGTIEEFREWLDADLRQMGKDTVWIGTSEMSRGMNRFCTDTNLPIVSLDDRYVSPRNIDSCLDVSRSVNDLLMDAGYDTRTGRQPLADQFDNLGRRYAGREIAVVDDVLFSGEMAAWLMNELEQRDVRLSAFGCGIAIGEGAEKLEALGVPVTAVRTFDAVDDELVERDFAVLPGSGRKVFGRDMNSLYFDIDYGRPSQWASIPLGSETAFCVASLERSLRLLRPDVPIAPFVGYERGDVGPVLRRRLAQLEQKEGRDA